MYKRQLANRLSANPNNKILLLEAGGKDSNPWIHIPGGYFKTMHNPKTDWCFNTEQEPNCDNRQIIYPRGKHLVEVLQLMECFILEVNLMTIIIGDNLET